MEGYIKSEKSTLILNDNKKFLDKEVPMTSEEGSSLLPVSQDVFADNTHLLSNVENEGN